MHCVGAVMLGTRDEAEWLSTGFVVVVFVDFIARSLFFEVMVILVQRKSDFFDGHAF